MKFNMGNDGLDIHIDKNENLKESLENVYYTLFSTSLPGGTTLVHPTEDEEDKKLQIRNFLKQLGIPCHILGYEYLQTALELVLSDNGEEYKRCVTKMLYPDIAAKYHTSTSRVERAIRHAIEIAASKNYNGCLSKTEKMVNTEFIVLVSEYFK